MIELQGVSKSYRSRSGERVILDDVDYRFEAGCSVGLLGRNGVGKSTVIRMLSGIEKPTRGRIRRGVRVSWPLAFSGGFHKGLSGRENVVFAARIYGQDVARVRDFVLELSGIDDYFDMPVNTYSSGMRARLSLALSLAIEFDVYLVDEIPGVADVRFQKKYLEALNSALRKSDVIMVSHNPKSILQFCQRCIILHKGKFLDHDTPAEAFAAYNKLLAES